MTTQDNTPQATPLNDGVKELIRDLGWKFDHYTQSVKEVTQQLEAIAMTSPAAAEAVALHFCKQDS